MGKLRKVFLFDIFRSISSEKIPRSRSKGKYTSICQISPKEVGFSPWYGNICFSHGPVSWLNYQAVGFFASLINKKTNVILIYIFLLIVPLSLFVYIAVKTPSFMFNVNNFRCKKQSLSNMAVIVSVLLDEQNWQNDRQIDKYWFI